MVAVNQSTETEVAQSITVYESFKSIGQASEVDTTYDFPWRRYYAHQPSGSEGGGPYYPTYQAFDLYPHQEHGQRGRFAQAVMAEGPEAYWRFDEVRVSDSIAVLDDGGPIFDQTGNGHHAVGSGSDSLGGGVQGLLPGDSSTALVIRGTSGSFEYPQVSYGAWMDAPNFTATGIIKTGSKSKVIWGRAISSLFLWELGTDVSGHLYFRIGSTTITDPDNDVTALSSGFPTTVWTFAVRRVGNAISLIVNGEVKATGTFSTVLNPGAVAVPFCFGNRYAGHSSLGIFSTTIDEFAFFSHGVSDAELASQADLWASGQSVAVDVAEEINGDKTLVLHGHDAETGGGQRYRTYDNEQLIEVFLEHQLKYVDLILRSNPWAAWDLGHPGGISDASEGATERPSGTDVYSSHTFRDYSSNLHGATLRTTGVDEDDVPLGGKVDTGSSLYDDYQVGQLWPYTHYEPNPALDITDGDTWSIDNLFLKVASQNERTRILVTSDSYAQSDDLLATDEATLECWLTLTAALTAPAPLITMAAGPGSVDFDKCLYIGTDGKLRFIIGHGGGRETLVAGSAFPVNKRFAHVVASVGPDGAKIRVDGVDVATSATTTSWTDPQYVFLRGGGSEVGLDFLANVSDATNSYKVRMQAPAVYDKQLPDAETDLHLRGGRSYQFLLNYWGSAVVGGPSPSEGDWNTTWAQRVSTVDKGPFGLLPSEPYMPSSYITSGGKIIKANAGGASITDKLAFACIFQPDGLGPTDAMTLMTCATHMAVNNYDVDSWILRINDERLEFAYLSGTRNTGTNPLPQPPTSVPTYTCVHSTPIEDGDVAAIGFKLDGTSLTLTVNGTVETFTLVGAFYHEGGSGDSWTLRLGRQIDNSEQLVGNWTGIWYLYKDLDGDSATRWAAMPSDTMELLTEAAAWQYEDAELIEAVEEAFSIAAFRSVEDVTTALETEVAQPIAPLFNQEVSIGQAGDTETAAGLAQIKILGMVEEVGEAFFLLPSLPVEADVDFVTTCTLQIDSDVIVMAPVIVLSILTPVLNQAPGSIELTAAGGEPLAEVVFSIDGDDVWTGFLDSSGSIGPITLEVDTDHGAAGSHTVTVTQPVTLIGSPVDDNEDFTILLDPPAFPVAPDDDPGADVVAGAVIGGVLHWVLQDPVASILGGIGSYVMPYNPDPTKTTSPFPVKQLTSRRTTAANGIHHIFQGITPPKEWSIGGYAPTEEMVEALLAYRALNRRIYIIDNRNRAWICSIIHVAVEPRLRQIFIARGQAPVETDWGHDYTITAMVLDPIWRTPA